ncbi:hypothetical protein MUK42_26691 [Musa troglodytarum]|uniref:Uncharacterized protein n=1 Tax=Musa troglodytarum TaxID=320322 RepID=A0A9E7F1Q7_9LILI|nr:hypothetical protein MUK42_26691 [Musa troglodytarum]
MFCPISIKPSCPVRLGRGKETLDLCHKSFKILVGLY